MEKVPTGPSRNPKETPPLHPRISEETPYSENISRHNHSSRTLDSSSIQVRFKFDSSSKLQDGSHGAVESKGIALLEGIAETSAGVRQDIAAGTLGA
jgi:hypothetical protein